MTLEEAVQEYQCPGCVGGPYPECFTKCRVGGVGCGSHSAGTMMFPAGTIFLGMEKGFNRVGPVAEESFPLLIFKDEEQFKKDWSSPFGLDGLEIPDSIYDKANVPCWKYLDKHGNTIVRGLAPRRNMPFLHVFLCDLRDKIPCIEITNDFISQID